MDQFTSRAVRNPQDKILPLMEHCQTKVEDGCITVGYHIIGEKNEEFYHSIMKQVAKENHMKFGSDIEFVSWGHPNEFWKYLDLNKNKTLFGVIFCGES